MRAVIFDLFGTLVDNLESAAWTTTFARIAEHLGADPEAFLAYWETTFRDRMEGRLRDDEHVFEGTAQALGLSATREQLREASRMRDEFMRGLLRPKDDAIECLRALRAGGLDLALATDCSSGTPALLDRTPLGAFFEVRAASAHLGVGKPHPAMYEHVLRGLGVEGADCWYVGDGNSEELPGAKRHGMTTVWVDNGEHQFHEERFVPGGDHTIRRLSELPGLLGLD